MKTLPEIESKLRESKSVLFKKYPLKSIAIFGSYSGSTQKEQSDLDIIVDFTRNMGIEFIDLAEEIESLVGLKIDLVSRKGIKDKYFRAIDSDLIYV